MVAAAIDASTDALAILNVEDDDDADDGGDDDAGRVGCLVGSEGRRAAARRSCGRTNGRTHAIIFSVVHGFDPQ